MNAILTDELVEKAAHAFYARIEEGGHEDPNWRKDMRAAILAILPDIVEACAVEAQEYQDQDDGWQCGKIGDRIRALASLSFQDGKQ